MRVDATRSTRVEDALSTRIRLPKIDNGDARRDMISCYGVGTPGDRRFRKLVSSALHCRENVARFSCGPSISMPTKSSPKSWDEVVHEYRSSRQS